MISKQTLHFGFERVLLWHTQTCILSSFFRLVTFWLPSDSLVCVKNDRNYHELCKINSTALKKVSDIKQIQPLK